MSRHPAPPHSRNPWPRIGLFAAAAALILLLRTARRFEPAIVRGESMAPTLRQGDRIAIRPGVRPEPGQIVLVLAPGGRPVIKRVFATSGTQPQGRTLPPGTIDVRGDNAAASTDSRTWGALPLEHVRGVAVAIWWPPARIGRLRRR